MRRLFAKIDLRVEEGVDVDAPKVTWNPWLEKYVEVPFSVSFTRWLRESYPSYHSYCLK